MPDAPSSQIPTEQLLELLADAGLVLAAYNRELARAGYPFRAPHRTPEILSRIDAALFPHLVERCRAK
jgi:hypothetical protein